MTVFRVPEAVWCVGVCWGADKMEDWDQEKLESVVASKGNEYKNVNKPTEIVRRTPSSPLCPQVTPCPPQGPLALAPPLLLPACAACWASMAGWGWGARPGGCAGGCLCRCASTSWRPWRPRVTVGSGCAPTAARSACTATRCPGYVLKSQMKQLLEEEAQNRDECGGAHRAGAAHDQEPDQS